MHSQPQRIPLSALWIALHCPNVGQVDRCSLSRPSRPGAPHRMAGHVLYGGRGARPGEDAQQVQRKRYEDLMPNMKCEQFIKEVLDISQTAAGKKYGQAIIKFAPYSPSVHMKCPPTYAPFLVTCILQLPLLLTSPRLCCGRRTCRCACASEAFAAEDPVRSSAPAGSRHRTPRPQSIHRLLAPCLNECQAWSSHI
jgi:hypothetical protein